MEGVNEVAPESKHKDFPVASCVHDQMLGYIRDAKMPKEAWENLKKIFAASSTAWKLQLRQELNNIQQKNMSITVYNTIIKVLSVGLKLYECSVLVRG